MIVSAFRSKISESKEDVMKEVKSDSHALCFAHAKLQDDEDVVLEAVRSFGFALSFASERLRGEKGIVLEAVKNDGKSIKYANDSLRKDSGFLKECIKSKGWESLEFVTEEMKKDDEEMKALLVDAVKSKGENLTYSCCEDLRDNLKLVLQAVKENGRNIEFVSHRLRWDRNVLLTAARDGKYPYVHLRGETLLKKQFGDDKELFEALVGVNGLSLSFASQALKRDRDLVLSAVTQNGMSLKSAGKALKRDRDVVLAALKSSNGCALKFASSKFKKDREVVMLAVSMDALNLEHASQVLKSDKEVVLTASKVNIDALKFADESCLLNSSLLRELITFHRDGTILWVFGSKKLLTKGTQMRDMDLMVYSLGFLETYTTQDLPFKQHHYLKTDSRFLSLALRKGHLFVIPVLQEKMLTDAEFMKLCLEVPEEEEDDDEEEEENKKNRIEIFTRLRQRRKVRPSDYFQNMLFKKLMERATRNTYYWDRSRKNYVLSGNRGFMLWCAERYDNTICYVDKDLRSNEEFMKMFYERNISCIHEAVLTKNCIHDMPYKSHISWDYQGRANNPRLVKISEQAERWIFDAFRNQGKYKEQKKEDMNERLEFLMHEMFNDRDSQGRLYDTYQLSKNCVVKMAVGVSQEFLLLGKFLFL